MCVLGLNLVSGSAALLLLLSNIYSTLTDSSNVYPVHLLIDTNTGHTPSPAAAVAVAVWVGGGKWEDSLTHQFYELVGAKIQRRKRGQ